MRIPFTNILPLAASLCVWAICLPCLAQETSSSGGAQAPLSAREKMLLDRIDQLEQRLTALESKVGTQAAASAPVATVAPDHPADPAASNVQAAASTRALEPTVASAAPAAEPKPAPFTFLDGTTLNFYLDTYYAYNFNDPIGRVNLLRAYDVSSNAISLNQAAVIVDKEADPANGKRWGLRLDFQYGQATETLQGNPANEPRPDIYRNIFQAYGTYVLPVGSGLKVDFGKFASSLGYEGNYSKDQMNYSRSYWFNFLPFYHMGLRAQYQFSDKVGFTYWAVNGTQQTEPFNGFKDQFFGFAFQPAKNLSWNVNYYLGQEHPDVQYFPNGGAPAGAPAVQGVPFEPIVHAPKGKLHIFDTYVNWQANAKLRFATEINDVIQRLEENSSPSHTAGGSLYAGYQLSDKWSLAGRGEYLTDRGGLFSGATQALKETTLTGKYQVVDGLDLFLEWRRDFSNQPFFYTDTLGKLKKDQNTATLGLVWWMGGKQGAW